MTSNSNNISFTLTPKQEILKRLLEDKSITFEEFLILNKQEVEYINTPWYNPQPLNPYFTNPYCTTITSTNLNDK